MASPDKTHPASRWGFAFQRKSLEAIQEDAQADAHETGPKLALFDLLCIGIGSTIGSGVFILTGEVLPIAGPSAVLCWALAGLVCLLSAFSYIELCMRIPTSGSCYAYSHHALGELAAVVGAICLTMEYGIAGAGVARSWSQLVASLTGGSEYMYLWYPGADRASSDFYFDFAAGLVMLASVAVCSSGLSIGKVIINSFTMMKLALVAFLIIAGLAAWHINILESTEVFFPKGPSGVMRGISALFFGFIGFDEVCCLAGKTENPTYTMPRALAGTLAAAASLSMLAQLVLAGMVPAAVMLQWPEAFAAQGWQWARLLVNVGEVVLLPLVVLLSFLPQPELLGIMGKDGLIPKAFARKNTSGTFVWGSNASGAVMVIIAAAVPFSVLWDMISLGCLLGFNLTNTSLIMVRYGNGGSIRAVGLAHWVAGFWATGAVGAYTLWKGVVHPALEGGFVHSWAPTLAAASLASALASLAGIARHEEHATEESAKLFRVPAVPLVPGLAIVLNFVLMATFPWLDHLYMCCCILAFVGMYCIQSRSRVAQVCQGCGSDVSSKQDAASAVELA